MKKYKKNLTDEEKIEIEKLYKKTNNTIHAISKALNRSETAVSNHINKILTKANKPTIVSNNLDYDKALIVNKHWLDKIFNEGKDWEMRTRRTSMRGKIGLIEKSTGMIVGETIIYGCSKSPISKDIKLINRHKIEDLSLLDKWRFAWYLRGSKRYKEPIPYNHPKGAVIWVKV